MGLTAIVFKSIGNLPEFPPGELDVDPETGEVALRENSALKVPVDKFVSERQRLGNIAEIGFLREAVESELKSSHTLLGEKVLYSGSHSGDWIPLDEFERLADELSRLRGSRNADLARFTDTMQILINAAQKERNPIVFV